MRYRVVCDKETGGLNGQGNIKNQDSDFQKKEIRKTIVDVIEALTGSERPRKYWNDLKTKLFEEGYSELSEKIGQLKLQSGDSLKINRQHGKAERLQAMRVKSLSGKAGRKSQHGQTI